MTQPILQVDDLQMSFPSRTDGAPLRAVAGVSFTLYPGETLGVVGESGCGKSTTGYCLVRAYRPTAGSIIYRQEDGTEVDLATLPEKRLKPYRKELRMIFQDPYSSLNPRMTIFDIIAEPLRIHGTTDRAVLEEKVADLLHQTGMRPEFLRRYPHAFSGGQRQRIVIARALALDPRIIVADEAVSALDVSVQAQILNLMKDLQRRFGLTYVFISHALNVVEYMADRVAVMYLGRIVEMADTAALYGKPKHPYTEALLSAIPVADPKHAGGQIVLEGEVPDLSRPPSGCPFHPRCRYARPNCRTDTPALRNIGAKRLVACHYAEELDLRGAFTPPSQINTVRPDPPNSMNDKFWTSI